MKLKNLTVLGLIITGIIFLIIVYAQGPPPPPAPFVGTVFVNNTPADGAVVYVYNVSGGSETLCGSDSTTMVGDDAWFTDLQCDYGVDKSISFKVQPAGESTSYPAEVNGADTIIGTQDTQTVYIEAYTGTGSPPTSCEINADCTLCSNWRAKEGKDTHVACTSPGDEGCVRNSGGGDAPPYDQACCGGKVRGISIF